MKFAMILYQKVNLNDMIQMAHIMIVLIMHKEQTARIIFIYSNRNSTNGYFYANFGYTATAACC